MKLHANVFGDKDTLYVDIFDREIILWTINVLALPDGTKTIEIVEKTNNDEVVQLFAKNGTV